MVDGALEGRRSDGCHNSITAVSPDMLLEQSYNADVKEESGLDSITMTEAARTKWVDIKPLTAAISSQFMEMLHGICLAESEGQS